MPATEDTNQTGRALQYVTVPDLELRMAAFLSAQAAGYDLIERGTGRRITFETGATQPQADSVVGKREDLPGDGQPDRPVGLTNPAGQTSSSTGVEPSCGGVADPGPSEAADHLVKRSPEVEPPQDSIFSHPAGVPAAATPTATAAPQARSRRSRPLAPKRRPA